MSNQIVISMQIFKSNVSFIKGSLITDAVYELGRL